MGTRALLGALMVLSAFGCAREKPCRPGTVLMAFQLPPSAALPASLQVEVTTESGAMTSTVTVGTREPLIEVHFPSGYPDGKSVGFLVTINGGQTIVLEATIELSPGCTTLSQTTLFFDGGADLTPGQDLLSFNDGGAVLGTACQQNVECASNHCVDGFCCGSACDDQCEACNVSGSEGTCSPVTGAPRKQRPACGVATSPCVLSCDGVTRTSCVAAPAECRPATCVAGTATQAASCNPDGTCPSAITNNCADGLCASASCGTVVQVAAGPLSNFTCALLSDKTVRCWGNNARGQLGQGESDTDESHVPIAVPGVSDVKQIAVGDNHACALLNNKTILCWGDDTAGQLGRASSLPGTFHGTPAAVPGVSNAQAVFAGIQKTCAVLFDNTAICWGDDQTSTTPHSEPIAVCAPGATATPCASAQNVVEIACGRAHSCMRLADHTIACWGQNNQGQLGFTNDSNPHPFATVVAGLPTGTSAPAQVVTARNATCILLGSGGGMCWGSNGAGELANTMQSLSATPVPGNMCADSDCIPLAANMSQLRMGTVHGCALVGTELQCWGNNGSNQLGIGQTTEAERHFVGVSITLPATPTSIATGDQHTCALLTDGRVRCLGGATYGQLGNDDTNNRAISAAPIW